MPIIGILLIAGVIAWAIYSLAPDNWYKKAALVALGVFVALWLIQLVFGVSFNSLKF